MNVTFYATLRNIIGAKTIELPLSNGMTVRKLVDEAIRRYPPLKTELLDAEGELYRHVHVFVNNRDAMFLEKGLDTELGESDTVGIFPAVGGGAG